MSADDDTELRDMLMQTLEKNGTLAKLRAQLRASVFLALDEQDKVKNKAPFMNEKFQKFNQTNEGRLCCELVVDLMKTLNLDAAESVFRPEINLKDMRSRQDLAKTVGVQLNVDNSNQPLLALLLKSQQRQEATKGEVKNAAEQNSKADSSVAANKTGKFPSNQSRNVKTADFEDDHFRPVKDDEDFFGEIKPSPPSGFSKITERTKSQDKDIFSAKTTSPGINEKKSLNTATDSALINPKLSGSGNSLSSLGGLPPLLGDSKKSAESNSIKQQNLMKLLGGDGFDDFENDSPRISENGSVKSPDAKDNASRPKLGNIGKAGKQEESPNGSKEKKSSDLFKKSENDEDEISEEIVEDLDVDDLLSSARSEQKSF